MYLRPRPPAASEDELVNTSLTQYLNFTSNDYLLSLPMLLLTLFALGILLIDLFLPKQWKQVNAIIALIGLAFSAAAVVKLQYAYNATERAGVALYAYCSLTTAA